MTTAEAVPTAVDTSLEDPLYGDPYAPLPQPGAGVPGGRRRAKAEAAARAKAAKTAKAQPAPLPTWAFALAWSLSVVALLALWGVVYGVSLSSVQERRNQDVAYAELREKLAAATAKFDGTATPGEAVALIDAPALGLDDVVIVQGTTSAELTRGPGHRADTVFPGQPGVSVLMGRSATFGAPFRAITAATPGSTITVTTGQGTFTYVVDRVRRAGDPVPAPPAVGASRLMLVTATADSWGRLARSSDTVSVDATLKGQAQPEPAGRPSSIPKAAKPMEGQPAALVPLFLWLQGLLIVVLACIWGQARWSRTATWLVGAPLVLAMVWGATQAASLLLPNLV